jgi:tRNA threonylcarbamoyladenosine biosynthesis protein TsaB
MMILALDTTTRQGSCALLSGDSVLRERSSTAAQTHAAHLPGDLMMLLDEVGLSLGAIDAFAVSTGPGSFTGLRVGIATMQGLAFAEGKPLYGVSALDALAAVAAPDAHGGRITAWIDAWRGEVYEATYAQGATVDQPVIARPEQLLAAATRGTLFIGAGAATHAGVIRQALGGDARLASPVDPPIAAAIARLAAAMAAAGDRPGPDAIRPLYVRRSDAERAPDDRPVR